MSLAFTDMLGVLLGASDPTGSSLRVVFAQDDTEKRAISAIANLVLEWFIFLSLSHPRCSYLGIIQTWFASDHEKKKNGAILCSFVLSAQAR